MIVPKPVVGSLVSGLAEAAHVVDDCGAVVGANDGGAGVFDGALEAAVGCGAVLDAVLLRGEVVDVEEVDEGRVGLLVVAGGAGVVDGVVNCVEVVCVGAGVLWEKMKKDSTKRVRAKSPERMVQKQSVHFRSFYSTGKFRNV
jgi:hypothetical protein